MSALYSFLKSSKIAMVLIFHLNFIPQFLHLHQHVNPFLYFLSLHPDLHTSSISIHLHVLPPVYQWTYTYYLQFSVLRFVYHYLSFRLFKSKRFYQQENKRVQTGQTKSAVVNYVRGRRTLVLIIITLSIYKSMNLHVLPPVFCVALCVPLFVLSSFPIWPLCCLSFDLQFRITPLVFSNFPTTLSNIERKFHQLLDKNETI
jgi:hypothetical protein